MRSSRRAVAANMARLAATGAVGCNFEDQVVGGEGLHPIELAGRADPRRPRAAAPISSSTRAPTSSSSSSPTAMTKPWIDEALERARAYAEAGASGFFVPGLVDLALIERLCAASPLPVNIMAFPGVPATAELAAGRRRADQPWPGPYGWR